MYIKLNKVRYILCESYHDVMMKIALIALLFVGVSVAYAETSTVEVPFDSHGQSCWFDELEIEYHCIWQGIKDKFTLEDLEEFKHILDETIYDEEIRKLEKQALAEIEAEKAKLTPNELIIQEIENKLNRGIATATDSVYMNLLKELNTCKQGMDRQTAPIQEAREFEISDFNLWKVNNVKYEGKLGEIVLAIEECRGQQALLKVVGEGYSNMPTGEADHQFSLMDIYTPDIQAAPYDKLTSTDRSVDMSAICNNNQFSIEHRLQFDCYVAGYPTNEQIEAENKLSGNYNYSGGIVYGQEIFEEYISFLEETGGKIATGEDKQREADKASIIVEELLSENAWYNRD